MVSLTDQYRQGRSPCSCPPRDARARLIRISQRGKEAQACAREMEQRLDAEFEAHLGPRRMRELRRSLESLRETTDPYV